MNLTFWASRTLDVLEVDCRSRKKPMLMKGLAGQAGRGRTFTLISMKLWMHAHICLCLSCRLPAPVVTKKTLEVVIPEHAVPSLMMRSGSKLNQISEVILYVYYFSFASWELKHMSWPMYCWKQMSGATVTLVEDRPEQPKRVIKISGSPEQAERAQSLLEGFILSSKSLLKFLFSQFTRFPIFWFYYFHLRFNSEL